MSRLKEDNLEEKVKKFTNNTIILFIGKFITQFISLLLLPLYTHYLLADDYGFIDLVQTYLFLFVPILTLRIDSAIFRFLIDNRNNNGYIKKNITNILFLAFCCIIFSVGGLLILNHFIKIKYFIYISANLILLMLSSVLLPILRGLGKNKDFSVVSIVTGITMLISNIVLITFYKVGAESILISSAIANFIGVGYIIYIVDLNKYCNFIEVDKNIIMDILKYSLPMIPNSLSWWVVNVSDRTIISIILGTGMNAIYSVSCKFSNILNSALSIISMSWQESASLHINDEDKDIYFSLMINKIFMIFACASLVIIAFLPFIFNVVIGVEYFESYSYIPLLLYANSWNVMIGLLGSIYIALKKTKDIAVTTIFSALINLVINILMIRSFGLYAACFSTLIAYISMSIYRYIDCQKYIKLKLNITDILIYTILFIFVSVIYIYGDLMLYILNIPIIVFYCYLINKKTFINIYNKLCKNK